jgi:TRAP-type C4-dicarboxylate transport system substrate-binding protein
MNVFSVSVATALALGVAAAGGPARAQAIDVKIGFATINDPQHEIGKRLADRLNNDFGGKFSARVFPSGQLGGIPRMVEGLQLGTQEVYIGPPGFLVGLNPIVQVADAPGLFDDEMHAHRSLTDPSVRGPYTEAAVSKGIRGLSLYVYGPTQFATLRPFRKIDDLKGMKIRVLATKMETELVSQFGATGVPMDYTEVLAALSNKTLDGVRSSIIVMGGSRFFTVTKSITVTNDGIIPSGTWVSEAWLQKLPADVRNQLLKMGKDNDLPNTEIALDFGKKAEQLWKDNGAEVIRLSAAEQKQFMDRVRPIGEKFLGTHDNKAIRDMYALLKTSVEKHRQR